MCLSRDMTRYMVWAVGCAVIAAEAGIYADRPAGVEAQPPQGFDCDAARRQLCVIWDISGSGGPRQLGAARRRAGREQSSGRSVDGENGCVVLGLAAGVVVARTERGLRKRLSSSRASLTPSV